MVSFTTAFGQEIKIGVIGPMKFVQGIGHWNGALLAADEINAKGGVNVGGKMMKIKEDSTEVPLCFLKHITEQLQGITRQHIRSNYISLGDKKKQNK